MLEVVNGRLKLMGLGSREMSHIDPYGSHCLSIDET